MASVARVLAVSVSMMAAAACSEAADGDLVGKWRGSSAAGVAVQLNVERELPGPGSVAGIEGVMMVGDIRCLRSAPFAGTLTQDVLEISASGAGTVSSSTFADVTGVVVGDSFQGTLELSGDGQLEACDLGRHALTLVR